MNGARTHHLKFAHQALPSFGLMGNPKALDILATPMGQPLLLDLWEKVGAELPKAEKLPPDGLLSQPRQSADGRRVIVIALPTPQRDGEAFYVAFAATPEKRKLLVFKEPTQLKCFALQRAGAGSKLVELSKEGQARDCGPGPQKADPQAFALRVGELTAS